MSKESALGKWDDGELEMKDMADEISRLKAEVKRLIEANEGWHRRVAELKLDVAELAAAREALALILDQVDYTVSKCAPNEMIAACLPKEIINKAKALGDK